MVELLDASAQKAKAEAGVLTAEAVEEAERQSKIALIHAEQKPMRSESLRSALLMQKPILL